jgi:hypothetical protein
MVQMKGLGAGDTFGVQFLPGSLVFLGEKNRFVFAACSTEHFDKLRQCLSTSLDTRSLFLSVTSLMLSAASVASQEFVVGEYDDQRTSILRMGMVPVAVTTDSELRVLETPETSLFAQGVFRGRLRSIVIGEQEPLSASSTFAAPFPCLLPVRSLVVSAPWAVELNDSCEQFTERVSESSDHGQVRQPDYETAEVATAYVAPPVAPAAPVVSDDLDESATVWPVHGSKVVSAPALSLPETSDGQQSSASAAVQVVTYSSIELPSVEASSTDEWQPPAPLFEGDISILRPSVDPLLTWAQPNTLPTSAVLTDDDADLTVLPEDLAQLRRSMVTMANQAQRSTLDPNDVFGVRCPANHFSDPTKPRCLFCNAELDLGQSQLGPRPILGQLVFSDGRVVSMNRSVLVGRKPTEIAGVAAELVAFPDDMMLSRLHLEVRLIEWSVVVIDRQSANGTNIVHPDGRPVACRSNIENPLVSGSTVTFGKASFTFESTAHG